MSNSALISIVVPIYDEEGNIKKLHEMLTAELERLWYDFEIIFVDDGSRDRSSEIVKELAAEDGQVRLISLSRNFGTQLAILAGLEYASGAAVIVMDGDLQHPPPLIREMIARWEEGFEVVYSVREETENVGLFRRLASSAFSRLFNALVDTKIEPKASDFRLMDRKVVDELVRMRERNRFFRTLVTWIGFRQTGVSYVAGKRHCGKSKWRFRKLLSLALDAITSFSTVPLRLCAYLGFIVALSGLPYALWAIYVRLFTDTYVPGWAAIIVAVLVRGGIQLVSLGILGEYVGRIYQEVKRRPLYITRERFGFADQAEGSEVNPKPLSRSSVTASLEKADTPAP
jgi:glycosyltransferase involved in cell wall biosynthesis